MSEEIDLTGLTEEQVETVRAFAQAVKNQNKRGIEIRNAEHEWVPSDPPLAMYINQTYRISKPSAEDYLKGHKACGMKVGDRAKMIRHPKAFEDGWDQASPPVFEEFPVAGHIRSDHLTMGFEFLPENAEHSIFVPHFVLEKVEPAIYLVSDNPESWSCSEEFTSKSEAIAFGKSEFKGNEFYLGLKREPAPPEEWWCAEYWLEHVSIQDDYSGDWGEDWDHSSKEDREELERRVIPVLAKWLDEKGLRPKFFNVDELEKVTSDELHYRPWTNDEAVGKTIVVKEKEIYFISHFDGEWLRSGCAHFTVESLFEECTQPDGSKCGELVGEGEV